MPEGHTIHNIARRHRRHLAGHHLTVSSPQGRFDDGAAMLNGRKLVDVEAHGKHLFYEWDDAPTLHVHLGLVGKFRTHTKNAPPPSPATRLVLAKNPVFAYLTGPMVCEILDPEDAAAIIDELGPDPLLDDAASDEFAARLARRRVPIGVAMLDQKVLAGVGNVYRSEVLFLNGINPKTPSNRIKPATAAALWDTTVEQLSNGLKHDRIITVADEDRKAGSRQRVYVYKRAGEPCLRCGSAIRSERYGQRKVWWCPTCQRKRS